MRLSPLLFAAVAATSVRALAQQVVISVPGPVAGAQFGKVCLRVPDQNGDGFQDVLVGAPGFSQLRGAIYCVSGAYLATGSGSQILWSLAPTANQGDLFGAAIADVGDLTGDGKHDFLVGEPGFDDGTLQDVGAIRLVDGSAHTLLSNVWGKSQGQMFGSSIAALSDVTGDGKREFVVGAPGPNAPNSAIFIAPSGTLAMFSGQMGTWIPFFAGGPDELGASLAGGFDIDHDGFLDFAVGAPSKDGPSAPDSGLVAICRHSPSGLGVFASFTSSIPGERLGTSLDAAADYDGDGAVDLVAGAPTSPGPNGFAAGRVLVLSGARLFAQTPPYDLFAVLGTESQLAPYRFGAALSAHGDYNQDGVGDLLIGSPGYFQPPFLFGLGGFTIVSGATGVRIGGATGVLGEQLGDAFAGSVGDFDGDGFPEFLAGAPLANTNGTDSGVIRCYRLFPCQPSIYCTGKSNSLGCTPAISFSGSPSASSGAPFLITATNFLNKKNGLLFYSHAPTSAPFQGGVKCAANPTLRTPPQSSGGSSSGNDCSGTYSFDFAAWIVNGVDPSLDLGSEVFAQYWSRDPASASHTSLSNALRLVVNP